MVCGLGPAGRALTHRALAHGLSVIAIDPRPERAWTATYGGWADELPGWLDPGVVAARVDRPVAWGTRRFEIDRGYAVFDSEGLRRGLRIDGAQVIADRVVEVGGSKGAQWARLSSGEKVTAGRVIDARGLTRSPERAEQTAFGVVVPESAWDEPLFMDWRDDYDAPAEAPPSFLYAIPLSNNRFLLEETCLAGRPALSPTTLRDRLHRRLRNRGLTLSGDEPTETVRFPLEGGRPGPRRFGALGGMLHPATGYSVTRSLCAADDFVLGQPESPARTRAVHLLRELGLRVLLDLPPTDLPAFFDAFFALPAPRQRAYLSGATDLTGTAVAMTSLFATLPWTLRRRLLTAAMGLSGMNRTGS
ncbi:lycopene cyclase family protein [Nocardia sp. NPDC004068]|uniref:lycopene cyclase family protein n=1 Tax=Nocardia sp. NPDC004068 TaxID=3364303 RepID=UPI0036CCC63F